MKIVNYDTEISMILKLVSDTGITLSSFSKELKVKASSIRNWKLGRSNPRDPEKTLNAIRKRAKILRSADLEKNDLYYVRDVTGITFESISEEMEISHQALDQFVREEWKSEAGKKRKKQCQEVLRSMGRRILNDLP
jgi:transcriptional regulator with XRE-family HTH domain